MIEMFSNTEKMILIYMSLCIQDEHMSKFLIH